MNKRKNVSEGVSLLWGTTLYETVWALTPDDVPIWDVIRGFPLSEPPFEVHTYSTEEFDLSWPQGDDTLVRGPSDTDLDMLHDLLHDPTWRPSPPPKRDYPRLVRANYTRPVRTVERSSFDVLNPLAALARYYPVEGAPDKRLLREVLQLNAQVGPVFEPENNTLGAWLRLALLVKAHFEVRENLELVSFAEVKGDLSRLRQEGFAEGLESAKISSYLRLARCARKAETAEELALEVISNLQEFFGERLRDVKWQKSGEFITYGTLYNWVHYLLANMWQSGSGMARCEGCERIFYPGRKGKTHCAPRCRVRKHEKTHAAQP